MKLLISIKNIYELSDAILGGADIIDIKDPSSGSLGLPDLDIVKNVIDTLRSIENRETSIALGDIDRISNMLKYVAFAVNIIGIDYAKIGIATNDIDIAKNMAKDIANVLSSMNRTKLVLVGYADYMYIDSIEPLKLIDIAVKVNARGVMIDTFRKNGLSTIDILSTNYLKSFREKAYSEGLITAIAGGIRLEHLSLCSNIGFDVVGVRGAVCIGKRSDRISKDLVSRFKTEIVKLNTIRNSMV